MNASILCLAALISGSPTDHAPVYQMTSKGVWVDTNDGNWVSTDVSTTPARLASRLNDPGELFQTSLRAQNSASEQYEADPPYGGDIIAPLHHGLSNMFGGMTQQPLLPDPFAGGSSGRLNGPQPYRFGTTTRADIAILPSENTNGAGDFGIMELNAELEYKRPLPPCWLIPWSQSWVWSIAPQFGYRSYDGPGTDTIGLSPDAYRFGLGMQLATPLRGPWSVQLDFDPSINTDFDQALSSNAYQFDGSGILYYRVSEQLMYAFGAGFLDRVDDQVIPYAGFVFTPNEYWEFRILYPESYISLFMGNIYGVSQWLYTRAEYHIEAYEVGISNTGVRDQIQIEDYRILLGIRSEGYGVSSFLEAGVVFGRDVKFRGPTRDFDPSSGFIARFGMRF